MLISIYILITFFHDLSNSACEIIGGLKQVVSTAEFNGDCGFTIINKATDAKAIIYKYSPTAKY